MGEENLLPKNLRQIGDIRGRQKICLEDYVVTYIRKKEQKTNENYLGILLGERKQTESADYVFLRGILEVPGDRAQEGCAEDPRQRPEDDRQSGKAAQAPDIQEDRAEEAEKQGSTASDTAEEPEQKTVHSPWEQLCLDRELYFPGWEIQGCCVIGACEPERMRQLLDHVPDAGRLLYHRQDQEERLYRMENGRYEDIRGYFVFYEQNRKMQEYMEEAFKEDRVEQEAPPEQAVRYFREKIRNMSEEKSRSFLKLAASFFVVTVLILGAILVNRLEDLRVAGSLPEAEGEASDRDAVLTASGSTAYTDQKTADGSTGIISEKTEGVSSSADAEETEGVSTRADAEETESVSTRADMAETGGKAVSADAAGNSGEAEASAVSRIEADVQEQTDSLPGSDHFWEDDTELPAVSENTVSEEAGSTDADASDSTDPEETDGESTEEMEAAEAASVRQVQAAYIIREGDTLADICKKYYGNLDCLEAICEANDIEDANLILPGQKIVLP